MLSDVCTPQQYVKPVRRGCFMTLSVVDVRNQAQASGTQYVGNAAGVEAAQGSTMVKQP